MTIMDFIGLVEKMRNAQKEYFKTRSKDVLIKSKELEKEVDSQIKEWTEKEVACD